MWFQRDLRIHDNPALKASLETALEEGGLVVPVFILDKSTPRALGQAQAWWLHYSLKKLQVSLKKHLVLRQGYTLDVLYNLIQETQATSVFWNHCYTPWQQDHREELEKKLYEWGITGHVFYDHLLFKPGTIQNLKKEPYKVFGPFWKKCLKENSVSCLKMPPIQVSVLQSFKSDKLEDWNLCPTKPNWAKDFHAWWTPGETGALQNLDNFLDKKINTYQVDRIKPSVYGTSRLSPHLHFGEISPRLVWERLHENDVLQKDAFLREIGWREFNYHLLYHFPNIPHKAFKSRYEGFPFGQNKEHLHLWQKGQTGYPIVDAGMRELWKTGWMHNRVRMITASFLVKHLLIDWRQGQAWFFKTLVDADVANNANNWQWIAGSGADAAPYFRIFNPIVQSKKCDPKGEYIRTWVPELKDMPTKWIHFPWKASETICKKANVVLGQTYPLPMVEHEKARIEALKAFKSL